LRFLIIPGSFNQEIKKRIKVVEAKKANNKIHVISSTSGKENKDKVKFYCFLHGNKKHKFVPTRMKKRKMKKHSEIFDLFLSSPGKTFNLFKHVFFSC